MTVDVYEDHIRFLGYHVPLDTSKLPPTAVAALVRELQDGVDRPEGSSDDEVSDAEDAERDRVLDIISTELGAKVPSQRYTQYVSDAAHQCALLVTDNFAAIAAETSVPRRQEMLMRWFEHAFKATVEAVAEDAISHRFEKLQTLIDDMD